jgi:hypothetical protein
MEATQILQLLDRLNDLLQQAHFDARDLQQHLPQSENESLPDQLHRIRILALQIRAALAQAPAPA